jgi:hypothetical protein
MGIISTALSAARDTLLKIIAPVTEKAVPIRDGAKVGITAATTTVKTKSSAAATTFADKVLRISVLAARGIANKPEPTLTQILHSGVNAFGILAQKAMKKHPTSAAISGFVTGLLLYAALTRFPIIFTLAAVGVVAKGIDNALCESYPKYAERSNTVKSAISNSVGVLKFANKLLGATLKTHSENYAKLLTENDDAGKYRPKVIKGTGLALAGLILFSGAISLVGTLAITATSLVVKSALKYKGVAEQHRMLSETAAANPPLERPQPAATAVAANVTTPTLAAQQPSVALGGWAGREQQMRGYGEVTISGRSTFSK